MDTSFKVINSLRSGCGDCNSAGCGSCGPATKTSEGPTLLTRRDLGRTILSASAAALLVGCSRPAPTEQATASSFSGARDVT